MGNRMIQDTIVSTNTTLGTTIIMDAVATKFFLTNIATSTIAQIREIKFVNTCGWPETMLGPHYDELIEEYCSGVPSAVIQTMIEQNVEILYQFVKDCVENNVMNANHLLFDRSRTNKPFWELILQALTEYTEFIEKVCEMKHSKVYIRYDGYNERIRELITR